MYYRRGDKSGNIYPDDSLWQCRGRGLRYAGGVRMESICAIFDTDAEYAVRLMNAMNSRKGINYRTIMFTGRGALNEYIRDKKLQLLIIDEELAREGCEGYAAKVVVLTEDALSGSGESGCRIYKYQPADRLISAIMKEGGIRQTQDYGNVQITGVYSPIHYAGRTSFSLALAKAYAAEGKRALYLNFEEFSGLSEILAGTKEGGLSDALYYYRQGKERFREHFERFVCMTGNIYYLPPVQCADDISCQSCEEWSGFVLETAGTGMFDVIVIDIANALLRPWSLLDICSRIIMPVREDYISRQKISDFDTYMLSMGRDDTYKAIEKMLLPRDNNAAMSKDFLDMVEYGTIGRYARDVVKKG